MFIKLKGKVLAVSAAVSSLAFAGVAHADGAAMITKVTGVVTENQEALWGVGATVVILSAIGLIIRKIRGLSS